jgi:hypothetical protein
MRRRYSDQKPSTGDPAIKETRPQRPIRSAASQAPSPLPSEGAYVLDQPLWRRLAGKVKSLADEIIPEEIQPTGRRMEYMVRVHDRGTGGTRIVRVRALGPASAAALARAKHALGRQ